MRQVCRDDLLTAEYLLIPGSGYSQHPSPPIAPGQGPEAMLTTITRHGVAAEGPTVVEFAEPLAAAAGQLRDRGAEVRAAAGGRPRDGDGAEAQAAALAAAAHAAAEQAAVAEDRIVAGINAALKAHERGGGRARTAAAAGVKHDAPAAAATAAAVIQAAGGGRSGPQGVRPGVRFAEPMTVQVRGVGSVRFGVRTSVWLHSNKQRRCVWLMHRVSVLLPPWHTHIARGWQQLDVNWLCAPDIHRLFSCLVMQPATPSLPCASLALCCSAQSYHMCTDNHTSCDTSFSYTFSLWRFLQQCFLLPVLLATFRFPRPTAAASHQPAPASGTRLKPPDVPQLSSSAHASTASPPPSAPAAAPARAQAPPPRPLQRLRRRLQRVQRWAAVLEFQAGWAGATSWGTGTGGGSRAGMRSWGGLLLSWIASYPIPGRLGSCKEVRVAARVHQWHQGPGWALWGLDRGCSKGGGQHRWQGGRGRSCLWGWHVRRREC